MHLPQSDGKDWLDGWSECSPDISTPCQSSLCIEIDLDLDCIDANKKKMSTGNGLKSPCLPTSVVRQRMYQYAGSRNESDVTENRLSGGRVDKNK